SPLDRLFAMTAPLKIAIAGLGTVGAGVLKLLTENNELVARRAGRQIAVTAKWFGDPVAMANEADAEIVVELIGGSDGAAKRTCEAAIARGRHVVTANKALLAIHGTDLARAAEGRGVALAFEAAVAGGIPVIK